MKITSNFLLYIVLGIVFTILYWKGLPFWESPRLWAEEGIIYFEHAYRKGLISVFQARMGYYAIIPSVTAYIATFLPLEYLPAFTQGMSFLFWGILFLLIIKINKEGFRSVWVKITITISVLLILLSTPEIFMNTINLQFITPFILLLTQLYDEEKFMKWQVYFVRILQVICLLNGVLGLFFIPYLLYENGLQKRNYRLILLYALIVIIHFMCLKNYDRMDDFYDRLIIKNNDMMSRMMGNYNFLIRDFGESIFRVLANRKIYVFGGGLFLWSLINMFKSRKEEAAFIFAVCVGILILFIDFAKLPEPQIGGRYLVIIHLSFCFLFMLLLRSYLEKSKLILLVLVCVLYYAKFSKILGKDSYCRECPKWKDEYHKIYDKGAKIHPLEEHWKMKLEKNKN